MKGITKKEMAEIVRTVETAIHKEAGNVFLDGTEVKTLENLKKYALEYRMKKTIRQYMTIVVKRELKRLTLDGEPLDSFGGGFKHIIKSAADIERMESEAKTSVASDIKAATGYLVNVDAFADLVVIDDGKNYQIIRFKEGSGSVFISHPDTMEYDIIRSETMRKRVLEIANDYFSVMGEVARRKKEIMAEYDGDGMESCATLFFAEYAEPLGITKRNLAVLHTL